MKSQTASHITEIPSGEYLIVLEGKKNKLMQANSYVDGVVSGVLDHDRAYNPTNIQIESEYIVARLGTNPANGTAYGCQIEPYRNTQEHADWGNVHWFKRSRKEDRIAIKTGLSACASKLNKLGLFDFVEAGAVQIEIRPVKGKHAGMYHFRTKDKEPMDRLILRPPADAQMQYVIMHEAGHGVWYRKMTHKQQARWIKLFHSFRKTVDYDLKDIERIRDAFIGEAVGIKEFRSQLDEGDAILFDACIDHCKASRATAQHIDLLVENGYGEAIQEMWPITLEDTDFDIAITEYAMKSPEEFFAESFAFHLTGQKIPKAIQTLLDKTLAAIKS